MPNLELIEYWTGIGSGYQPSGNTFTFDPKPISLTKDVSVKWRIRRPGYQRKTERARFRFNEKIVFKVTGSCNKDKRNELEWFAKRDSLFKLENCDMTSFFAEYTSDAEWTVKRYWTDAKNQQLDPSIVGDTWSSAYAGEPVYIVFESAKFTQREAKIDWFDYTVTLRRVHFSRH